jgi:hypothetical protein
MIVGMIAGMASGPSRHFWTNAYVKYIRLDSIIRIIQGSPSEIDPEIRHVMKFTRQLETNKIVPSLRLDGMGKLRFRK